MKKLMTTGVGVGLMLVVAIAWCHKPSDSYLALQLDADKHAGNWDIALRDLEYALGVDTNRDGAITWGELRGQYDRLAHYALSRLTLSARGHNCAIIPTDLLVDNHSDGAYAVLRFAIECPRGLAPDQLHYGLLFELDTQHRGLVSVRHDGISTNAVLSPARPRLDIKPDSSGLVRTFTDYWREGVWHIWIGVDHVLFLLTLVLPLAFGVGQHKGEQIHWKDCVLKTLKVVTAFTIAHSITLSLAAFELVRLPSDWVEFGIALSVVVASLNNIKPIVPNSSWLFPFGFGLVHGLGFANVLMDLGMPQGALIIALLGFNVGVETGQVVIVFAALPVLFVLANTCNRSVILRTGSALTAGVAAFWCAERLFV